MRIRKPRVMKIKSWEHVDDVNCTCICGDKANYNIRLTSENQYYSICKSCLIDRLTNNEQGIEIEENVITQSIKDDHRIIEVSK